MRVLHISSGLGTGGAERSLLQLTRAQQLDTTIEAVRVVGLAGADALSAAFAEPPLVLDLRNGRLKALRKLVTAAREFAPDVIQGWMYHGNLAASYVGWRLGVPVIWSIRHSLEAIDRERFGMRMLVRMGSSACFRPRRVVYNSHAGWATHVAQGYGSKPSMIIPNGVDIEHFAPNNLRFSDEQPVAAGSEPPTRSPMDKPRVLGCIARFHPMKGIADLLQAHSVLHAQQPTELVLAGAGMTPQNTELDGLLHGHAAPVRLLGEVQDVRRVYAQLDALVLPSRFGEGTPNALLEAMACEIPVVATRVGDVPRVVPDEHWLVEPGDVEKLAATLTKLFALRDDERTQLVSRNRKHVEERFNLQRCHASYRLLYSDLCDDSPRRVAL